MSAAGLDEGLDEGIDRRDHQMHVEGLFAVRAQRLDHARADGEVGNEMPIHHVDMDVVGARRVERAHLLAQAREVGRQDGWGDLDRHSSGTLN